jgi:hypothetical protein
MGLRFAFVELLRVTSPQMIEFCGMLRYLSSGFCNLPNTATVPYNIFPIGILQNFNKPVPLHLAEPSIALDNRQADQVHIMGRQWAVNGQGVKDAACVCLSEPVGVMGRFDACSRVVATMTDWGNLCDV